MKSSLLHSLKNLLESKLVQVVLISLTIISIVYYPLFFGKTLLYGDNYSLMVPGKIFTVSWLQQGILPFWNPNIFGGIPWIGDVNQSILYPSTLFFLLLPPEIALSSTIILHLLFSFVSMFFLSKKFNLPIWSCYLAAITWTFSPQITGVVNNISSLQSLSWMPIVVLAGLRIHTKRGFIYFCFAVLAQFVGGYPQHVLYTIITTAALSLHQFLLVSRSSEEFIQWAVRWMCAAIVVVLITMVAWLPFLSVLEQSTRVIQTTEQAASGSLQIAELVKLILPTIFDLPSRGMMWGPSWNNSPNLMLYITWFSLVIMGLAVLQKKIKLKRNAILLTLMLFSILVALGNNLPTFQIFSNLPLLNSARGMSTILMIPALIVPLLVFDWLNKIELQKNLFRWISACLIFIGAVSGMLWLIVLWSFDKVWHSLDQLLQHRLSESLFHTVERDFIIVESILFALLMLSLSTFLAMRFWYQKRFVLLILVIVIEMAAMTQNHLFYAQRNIHVFDETRISGLSDAINSAQYRVLIRNYNSPYTDFGSYWDAMKVREPFSDSYIDDTELSSFVHLMRMRDGSTPNWNMVSDIPSINGYTTLLPLQMHQDFSTKEEASINNLPQIMLDDPGLRKWSVGYYLVDTWFPDHDEVMPAQLVAEEEHWQLYEMEALPRLRMLSEQAVVVFNLVENPNMLQFSVQTPDDSGLILADRYDKNWQAEVNGERVKIVEHEGMRLLPLSAGEYEVKMQYVPADFYIGLSVTLMTSLILLFIFFKKPSTNSFE